MTLQKTGPASAPEAVPDLERRLRRRRRRGWLRWLAGGTVVAVVAVLVWVTMFSSVLGLQRIEVNGAHRVSVATVESAADVATGTPLARIDLGAVERRIEQIPAVASATVHRGWPHSLVISVTERTPLAAVHEHGRWWLMDRTGALFGSSASPNPGEPIVEIDGGPGPQTLREAAGVLGLLPADVSALTKRVSASSVDSITLHLTDGAQVRWGSAADGAQKAAVLRALLRHKAAFYDVSIPSQPAIKGR